VRAVRPIEAGEEVTMAYVDPTLPYHARQQALQDHFFFACRCPQCRPPPLALRYSSPLPRLMPRQLLRPQSIGL
jgi:hypothetical protein